jgi:hypothetical protein
VWDEVDDVALLHSTEPLKDVRVLIIDDHPHQSAHLRRDGTG